MLHALKDVIPFTYKRPGVSLSLSLAYDEPNTVAANKVSRYCALQYGHCTGCGR